MIAFLPTLILGGIVLYATLLVIVSLWFAARPSLSDLRAQLDELP